MNYSDPFLYPGLFVDGREHMVLKCLVLPRVGEVIALPYDDARPSIGEARLIHGREFVRHPSRPRLRVLEIAHEVNRHSEVSAIVLKCETVKP